MNDSKTKEKLDLELDNTALVTRGIFGGILMGLANLVPGISGGTMLLAAGILSLIHISEPTRPY